MKSGKKDGGIKVSDEMLAQLTGDKKRITRQISVLVVDDAVFNLSALRNILKKGGYAVNVATSGHDALDAFSRTLVDVAIHDIEMHDMSGIDIYTKMLEDPVTKSIPVVFVTADNDTSTVTRALGMGASGYVVKPYSDAILLGKVKAAAEGGQIDQGMLYLLKNIRTIRDMMQEGKLIEAAELFNEIPVDIFKASLVVMLNRLHVYLSGRDLSSAVKMSETILQELETAWN
ncbi:MAG: response regulator [Spirochaetaceae bacterium]|jgi:CheY-like chemotaxis protein|nr:response regulator [Spirochaetaceae bacterium]